MNKKTTVQIESTFKSDVASDIKYLEQRLINLTAFTVVFGLVNLTLIVTLALTVFKK